MKFKKKLKIHAITRESEKEIYFDWIKSDRKVFEGRVSVAQYFKQEYKPLSTSQLPCLVVRCGQRDTHYPIEVCRLVSDQHISRKLSPQQTAEMIRICSGTQPKERFDIIQRAAKDIALNHNSVKYLNEFSLKVQTQPISMSARVLDSPLLLEKNCKPCVVRDGKWRIGQLYRSADFNKWIVVNLSNVDDHQVTNFIETMKKYGQQIGMTVTEPICRVKMSYQRGMLKVWLI